LWGFHITNPAIVYFAGFVLAFKRAFDRIYVELDFFWVLLVGLLPAPDWVEEYPSAYQPPPTSLMEQGDMIFLAFLLHLGHLM
jgi:hypothetical protein